jgi:glycerol uptake facilitator-like aquaporin
MFSDTFAGIAPASVPAYIVAQAVGGALAVLVVRTLYPDVTPVEAADVLMPHGAAPEPVDRPVATGADV